MAIINRKRGNVTYVYEITYTGIEDGVRKYKAKCLGHLDESGNLIPSKKSLPDDKINKVPTEEEETKIEFMEFEEGPITPCPNTLAVPTLPQYENSISLHQEGNAYMQNFVSTDGLEFKDGNMYFKGALSPISTVELQDMRTNEGIEEIDIPLLTMYYSIILTSFQDQLKHGKSFSEIANQITSVSASELMKCLGLLESGSGISERDILNIMRKTSTFHNVVGVFHFMKYGRLHKSYFPVLHFAGYNSKNNTISFFSPYLNYIVQEIYSASIKRDKAGKPRLKRNGSPVLEPSNSFLIKPSIATERNKAAAENVIIIVKVIEQAGSKSTPHIKASTLIERNEILKLRLENSRNPVQLLARVFKKTWKLLQEQTILKAVYRDIILPDPEDKNNIPTPGNMDKLVFEFPHNGKGKGKTCKKACSLNS